MTKFSVQILNAFKQIFLPKSLEDVELLNLQLDFGAFYKSKLELKSNSGEILPFNCNFSCDSIPT